MKVTEVPRIFIAGIRKGAGKTTFSLGLFQAAQERFKEVGYTKPVSGQGIDPYTFRERFGIRDAIPTMNPILFTPGLSKDYILADDTEREAAKLARKQSIVNSFNSIADGRDFVLIEGTGNSGVGYCIDLSNVIVARLLKAPVLLMVEAGIGKTIDHSAQHIEYFDKKGWPISGVVVNRVIPGKESSIAPVLDRAFERLGVSVLGYMPFEQHLGLATAREIGEGLACTGLELSLDDVNFYGNHLGLQNFVRRCVIGAMPIKSIEEDLKRDDILLLIPAHRTEFIVRVLQLAASRRLPNVSAIIIAGQNRSLLPALRAAPPSLPIWHIDKRVLLEDLQDAVRYVIYNGAHKISGSDARKIDLAYELAKRHVNLDEVFRIAEGGK